MFLKMSVHYLYKTEKISVMCPGGGEITDGISKKLKLLSCLMIPPLFLELKTLVLIGMIDA